MTSDSDSSSVAVPELLGDVFSYPWRKLMWWLLIVGSSSGFFFLLNLHVISGRIAFVLLALIGLVIRCYFSAIESTVTGYGEQMWQGSGLSTDDLWPSLGRTLGAALMAWTPAAIAAIALPKNGFASEPWTTCLIGLGCEYFPMALLGIINLGGIHGALPHLVFPAIFRCGWTYGLAGAGLLLVPYSFQWAYTSSESHGLAASIAASAVAAYFLIAHGRLMGRIYLANRERIGWE